MWLLLLQYFSKYCPPAVADSSPMCERQASSNHSGRCDVEIRQLVADLSLVSGLS